jgi:hypothetical protein
LKVTATDVSAAVAPLFVIDGYALFYLALIFIAALVVTCLSYGYLEERRFGERLDEYYVLLLLATLGAGVAVASSHFASFLLGLETPSLSLVGLIAYPRSVERPIEAGIKSADRFRSLSRGSLSRAPRLLDPHNRCCARQGSTCRRVCSRTGAVNRPRFHEERFNKQQHR